MPRFSLNQLLAPWTKPPLALGLAACIATSCLTQPTLAQGTRPTSAGRIVKYFDFEEKLTNPGEVPLNWFRAQESPAESRQRPGYPNWNQAVIQYVDEGGIAANGEGAVKLPTDGGSTSLMLEVGVVPIFQNADYSVSALALTKELRFAGARVAAKFLDRAGVPIQGSERVSPVIRSETWKEVLVELSGEWENAAYIQVELMLVQPQDAGKQSGLREIFYQDVSGEVWFDDVAVLQLPRVSLNTRSPGNTTSGETLPELVGMIRDLTGESLSATIDVYDIDGVKVDSHASHSPGGTMDVRWVPQLPKFGWYRAQLDIFGSAGRVGGATTDFVWLPPKSPFLPTVDSPTQRAARSANLLSRNRSRFALSLRTLPPDSATSLGPLVEALGGGSITIPVWEENAGPETSERLVAVVDAMLAQWQEVTFSLDRVPAALAKETQVPADDPWSVLLVDPIVWLPSLGDVVDQYGQLVRRWQIGAIGDDRNFWRAEIATDLRKLRRNLSQVISGPKISLPTRLDRDWNLQSLASKDDATTLLAVVPEGAGEEFVGEAIKAFTQGALASATRSELTLVIEPLDPLIYGLRTSPREIVKRAVEAWGASSAAGATDEPGLCLVEPWTYSTGRPVQTLPTPDLAAWSNLVARLSYRRVVGSFPVADGVVCYILAPTEDAPLDRGGALVAWNRSAEPNRSVLEACLGENRIDVVDLFGNVRPATLTTARAGRLPSIRVPIGDDPVFFEGIDVELCRFLASFRIDPTFLESTNNQHEHSLIISNPWPIGITGKVTILEPGGFDASSGARDRNWRISPRVIPFATEPRSTISEPFSMAFTPTEEQGTRPFVVDIELTSDRPYGALTIQRSIEIGLKTSSMELSYAIRGADGEDLIIEAAIGNSGAEPLTLELTCYAPGLPRSKQTVADLFPSRQAVKRFAFAGKVSALRGKRIIVSAVTPEGGSRLNKSILIQ